MHEICRVRRVGRTVWIAHLFAVAVVRREDAFTAKIKELLDDAGTTFVNGFHSFDSRFHNAGVANHVGVSEIKDNQIVIGHPCEDFIGDRQRAHFRLQIVGSDPR